MKIIAFASQKGGSGKTTLAAHLAVQAERAGAGPVGVIDTDPQGTLADWHQAREAGVPRFARANPQRLIKEITAMRVAGIKLLIIDTPPAIGSTIGRVIAMSDLVVIPTRPSPHDLRAVGATVEIAEGLSKPLIFVLNGAAPRARIAAEAAIALSQHGPLAPSVIHQRVVFAGSMIDGRTAMEIPGRSRSSEEVGALWTYVKKRLARNAAKKAVKKSVKKSVKKPAKKLAKKTSKKPTKKTVVAKIVRKRPARKRPVDTPFKKAA
jgi:chromosome partitioning protein